MVFKPAPHTPFNARGSAGSSPSRPTSRRGRQRRDVVRQARGRGARPVAQVDLISFTGSTAVGRRIMEKGAATMKRLFLELGGKSAAIVLDDADLEGAMIWDRRVHACRPGCATPTRMLLPRARYEEGVES